MNDIKEIDESVTNLRQKIQRRGIRDQDVMHYVGKFLKQEPRYGNWIHSQPSNFCNTQKKCKIKKKKQRA